MFLLSRKSTCCENCLIFGALVWSYILIYSTILIDEELPPKLHPDELLKLDFDDSLEWLNYTDPVWYLQKMEGKLDIIHQNNLDLHKILANLKIKEEEFMKEKEDEWKENYWKGLKEYYELVGNLKTEADSLFQPLLDDLLDLKSSLLSDDLIAQRMVDECRLQITGAHGALSQMIHKLASYSNSTYINKDEENTDHNSKQNEENHENVQSKEQNEDDKIDPNSIRDKMEFYN